MFCLNARRKMASVASTFAMGGRDPFECQPRGACLVANWQSHHQHAIAIREIGAYGIDWNREREFTVIGAHAPFIE